MTTTNNLERLGGVKALTLIFSQGVLAEILEIDEQGVYELCAGPRRVVLPTMLLARLDYLETLVLILTLKGLSGAGIASCIYAPSSALSGRAPDQFLRAEWDVHSSASLRVLAHARGELVGA